MYLRDYKLLWKYEVSLEKVIPRRFDDKIWIQDIELVTGNLSTF